jgi:hypothetical protein
MSFFFTPHSKRRFTERYGFEPTVRELGEIVSACKAGDALQMRGAGEDGSAAFRVKVRGVNVYPVVSAEGVIITFLPADFFLSSTAKAHRATKPGGPGKCRAPWGRDPYNRKRAEIEFGDEQ